MSAPVLRFPAIPLNASGLPPNHYAGRDEMARRLREWLHNLPSMPFLSVSDAQELADYLSAGYVSTVRGEQ